MYDVPLKLRSNEALFILKVLRSAEEFFHVIALRLLLPVIRNPHFAASGHAGIQHQISLRRARLQDFFWTVKSYPVFMEQHPRLKVSA